MNLRKILINTVWYGIIPKLPTLLSFLALPIITPFLMPSDYGMWGVISAYCSISVGLCTYGLHIHLTNLYYEKKGNYKFFWNQLFSMMLIMGLLTSILLAIFLYLILPINDLIIKFFVIILACLPTLLSSFNVITNSFCILNDLPRLLVIRNVTSGVFSIILLILSVKYWGLGFIGWVISYGFTALLFFILIFKRLIFVEKIYPSRISYSRAEIYSIILISMPLIPHNLGHILLSSSDRIVMEYYGISSHNIGLYFSGYQLSEFLYIVILGLCTALTPIIQEKYRNGDFIYLNKIYFLSYIFCFLIVFLGALWMKEVFNLMIRNPLFSEGYKIAVVNTFSYFSAILYYFFSTKIFIEKDTKHILWLIFVPAIINVLLNIIFIPYFGYFFAVYSTIISFFFIFLLPFFNSYFKFSYLKMFKNLKSLVLIIFIYLLFCFFTYFMVDQLLIFKILYSFFLIFLSLYVVIFKLNLIRFD